MVAIVMAAVPVSGAATSLTGKADMIDDEWSVEDVADVYLDRYGGVSIRNICCANRSLTVTTDEARQFAAILLAAADAREQENICCGDEAEITMKAQNDLTLTLRDRIAAAIAKADQDWCSDNPLYEDMADAVIAELNADCIYRYSCYHCGDFWFDKSERMQRFALLHGKAHVDE